MDNQQENRQITRTRDAFLKIRKIEKDLATGDFQEIDYFLKYSGDQAYCYALEWASYYGNIEYVKKIISNCDNIKSTCVTPLQMACKNGHLEVIKYIIEKFSITTLDDSIFLEEAVENNHIDVVKYLLDKNNQNGIKLCDIHANNDCAIRIAVNENLEEMTSLLIYYRADINIFDGCCIIKAVKKGNYNITKILLEAKIKVEYIPFAIDIAKENGYNEIVTFLEPYLAKN